jgi:hypothetical protein
VLKLSTVRRKSEKILGDNLEVIQSWIHTNQKTKGFAAINAMRFSRSLSVGLCANLGGSNYQPTPGGLDRQEKKI